MQRGCHFVHNGLWYNCRDVKYQLHLNISEQSTIQMENDYSTHMSYNYRNSFILINNDSICHLDHCFLSPNTHQREIMQSKRLQKVSDILLSQLFPHTLPNFILRLLDMPKLSLNLIIPLTSVFQPQFLLKRVILARQRAWQENTEHRMCSNALPR